MFGRHLVVAVILGSVIGYERRGPDRPAGIRTMSLIGELRNNSHTLVDFAFGMTNIFHI